MKNAQNINLSGLSKFDAYQTGRQKRQRMVHLVENLTNFNQREKFPHLYIYSPPGLGKTFTVKQQLARGEVPHFLVSGNTSLFAFGIQLAVINFQNPQLSPVIVSVDDCDEIFKDTNNCNTMKNALDGDQRFVYEKSLASQWANLSPLQKEAIQNYNEEGKMGFAVPTHNMRFIFTSNFRLPGDDEVRAAREKGSSKSTLMVHRNAIRSRCKTADFELSPIEHWGWMADVILNTDCLTTLELSDHQKHTILGFIWDNWSYMTERSIRTIEKMGEIMKTYPTTFLPIWIADYLKSAQWI